MAEVLPPTYTTSMENSQDSMGGNVYPNAPRTSAPAPNPNFSFPSLSPPETLRSSDFPEPEGAPIRSHGHRSRPSNISISPMPPFGFPEPSPGKTPPTFGSSEPSPTRSIPMRSGGHRREGSQFIGGDGTATGPGLMSTSPTKAENMLPSPPASGRRRGGHAHRRSGAISQHDLSAMLKPRDNSSSLISGSAPNSPADPNRHKQFMPSLDHSASLPTLKHNQEMPSTPTEEHPSDKTPQPSPSRATHDPTSTQSTPTSRTKPRVGFSDNLEFIPRPLSTISSLGSDESDSQSTIRAAHSTTGSINSLVSFSSNSPPSAKKQQHTAETLKEYELGNPEQVNTRFVQNESPLGAAFRCEGESSPRPSSVGAGMVLKQAKPITELANPFLASHPHNLSQASPSASESDDFPTPLASPQFQSDLRRLRGFGGSQDIDLDQRPRSSPEAKAEKKQKKAKGWAGSLLSRKPRTKSQEKLDEAAGVETEAMEVDQDSPIRVAGPSSFAPMDEFDLDNVNFDEDTTYVITSPDYQPHAPSSARSAPPLVMSSQPDIADSTVLDLDAHWAAMDEQSNSESSASKRRTMHSSGTTGGFIGPGMHYHRRAESAPALTPVAESASFGRLGSNSQMADVFEEDEDEEAAAKDGKTRKHGASPSAEERELLGLGVKIIDSDEQLSATASQRSARRKPANIDSDASESPLETPEPAATSPTSPQDFFQNADVPVEVVDAVDEPRFSVVTKSSDESTITPTMQEPPRPATANIPTALDFAQSHSSYLDTPTINSSNPSPDPQHLSFEGPRLHTAASSITDKSTWSMHRNNGFVGGPLNSTEDVPSLTSSASTMISGQPQMSPGFPPGSRPSADRSFSFSGVTPRTNRPQSAGGKRSSLVSLSRIMGSSHGQKSKLSVASFAPEEEPKSEKKKRNRLSKLKFWKSKERLRDSET